MTFHFETLGDERFQELAHALLVECFPTVQCFPVGQPDGGRDAVLWTQTRGSASKSKQKAVIFQVKFSRSPNDKTESKVIQEVIKTEKEKVAKLIARGATSYFLITNVLGSAHLDVGSIDRINEQLSIAFNIDCYCWWRADLDARVAASSSIKWSFPEILKGTDVLQALVEGDGSSAHSIRRQALQSYLLSQYQMDREVKFKQVELQNKLLDLFVDLPVSPKQEAMESDYYKRKGIKAFRYERVVSSPDSALAFQIGRHPLERDAADELLVPQLGEAIDQIVLEGAPGQGKSTITQYVCQVHRIRLLSKAADLALLKALHRRSLVRIPFRIDIRDYATWLGGKNPFDIKKPLPESKTQNLEDFVATQVSYLSGGQLFSVSDLYVISKESRLCIVLDGFDEVADINIRTLVVEQITAAARRIRDQALSAQFIVTSRPAAFANSPGFSDEHWFHMELKSLTVPQRTQYARKWMKAKALAARERQIFEIQLNQKLSQTHTSDLARNPMQLSILLSLISTKGASLPDKRTSLYDSYVSLFFDREAEKSAIVRDYRDLLVNIHRFIAWRLHSDAEAVSANSGSIDEVSLKSLLSAYLVAQGHDTDLVQSLFTGMVERVVALVSRVQGTFEFEVQPLREYFAARYLYETAPYSPPGSEQKGTKPEIFSVISQNFYWLNVTRFFCGCYSQGELSSLIDGLESLAAIENYRLVPYSRTLAIMLLNDYVFSQQPAVIKRAIDFLFSGIHTMRTQIESFVLPERCGMQYAAEVAQKRILAGAEQNVRGLLLRIIRQNTDESQRMAFWRQLKEGGFESLERWVSDGWTLGVITNLPYEELKSIAEDRPEIVRNLAAAGNPLILQDEWFASLACRFLLDGEMDRLFTDPQDELRPEKFLWLTMFCSMMLPLVILTSNDDDTPAQAVMVRFGVPLGRKKSNTKFAATWEGESSFVKTSIEQAGLGVRIWKSSTKPWSMVVDALLEEFGPRWGVLRLALFAAAIRSSREPGSWANVPWSSPSGICDRMRFARLKVSNISWWQAELRRARLDTTEGQMLALITICAWGSPKLLRTLASDISSFVDSFDQTSWLSLYRIYQRITSFQSNSFTQDDTSWLAVKNIAPRLKLLVAMRADKSTKRRIVNEIWPTIPCSDNNVQSYFLSAFIEFANDENSWKQAIIALRKANESRYCSVFINERKTKMPLNVARMVCEDAILFPNTVLNLAQQSVTEDIGINAGKVGEMVKKEGWAAEIEVS